jgi:hypothetical protein
MNKAQEEAWILLFLMPICAAICGALAIGLAYVEAVSFVRLLIEFVLFVIFGGFLWLWPFLRKRWREKKQVVFDERDQLIHKRAVLAAYVVLWLYLVAVCVIPWWLVGPHGSISANMLPFILIGALAIFTFVQNLAVLVQYGWGGKGEKS